LQKDRRRRVRDWEMGRGGDGDDEFNICLEKYWILFYDFLRFNNVYCG